MTITIETIINSPVEVVWLAWTDPDHIVQWNAASADWHTTSADIDLRVGGHFTYRMEAKDGSVGFDFAGTFTKVDEHELIEYMMGDGRGVSVEFVVGTRGVTIRESFEAESELEAQRQREGWQAILNNFAKHVEALG